ncbi:MAG: hypothetical protein WED87_00525, partial [Dehalococcoidia bacterium]
ETPMLLAIMRMRAAEAVELLGRSCATEVEKLQADLALAYGVEAVGRCAAAVPETDRRSCPTLDWERLVEHRPALLENYRHLDMNEVRAKIRDEFPQLVGQLDEVLGPEDSTP